MSTDPDTHAKEEVMREVEPVLVPTAEHLPASGPGLQTGGEGGFQSLPIEALRLDRFVGGIFIAIVVLVCLIGMMIPLFVSEATLEVLGWAATGCLMILGAVIYGGWFYPKAAHRCASWRISEHGLEIRRGVWWRHRIVIPHSRMQHSDIEQGPLQRMYSLATLVIHTAGTKDSSIQLENLNFETAEQLRDALTSGHGEMSLLPERSVTA
ncbi:MAG: PH domain-containing protein [Rhodopirellula sp. JB055]|uniref:PH domain-containing protein n=1 Tax=Rhodopirellula sp. JB055 TaxID=3342846 RepID=UPI00370AE8A5